MSPRTAWIVYSLLRLAFFAVPFAALMLLLTTRGFPQLPAALISAIVAALVAVSLSVIFLSKPREAAAESIYAWRSRDRTADDVAEDEAMEASESGEDGGPDAPEANEAAPRV